MAAPLACTAILSFLIACFSTAQPQFSASLVPTPPPHAGFAPTTSSPTATFESSDDESVTKRFNYFDLELLQAISKTTSEDNVCVSPASVKTTLAILLEGARGNSALEIAAVLRVPPDQVYVRKELEKLLYDISTQTALTTLHSANGVFISDKLTLQGAYRRIVEGFYKAEVRSLNYERAAECAQTVNQWVASITRDTIPSIVTQDNFQGLQSAIVVANALYFKSVWKYAFDPSATNVRCFYLPNGACRNVHMMHNTAEVRYRMVAEINAHALELPYADGFAMLVLLPQDKHGVDALLRDLQHVTFNVIVDRLRPTEVVYDIPRFDIDSNAPLKSVLQKLNVREVFSANANLSGMVRPTSGNVRVDDMLHKARVAVDESGTIAAAATAAVVIPLMGSVTPHVVANHAFAFFIYKTDNRNIVFEGVVRRPTEAAPAPAAATPSQARQPRPHDARLPAPQPLHTQARYFRY